MNINIINKKFFLSIGIILLSIISLNSVSAHCLLCTGAAIAGVGAARFIGVDDSIVGLFLGAFIISTALWFNKWLVKKKVKIRLQEIILVLISFALLVVPLYTAGLITNFEMVKSMPEHHSMLGMGIYGIDKLFFGIITGSLAIWMSFTLNDYIKEKRGRILWPYQGISFMLITLVILSFTFWLITK